ncbi:MAG: hypothetical protein FJY75_09040 [Candidatus Eisenbacteria bacterium]|uniref:FlgD Ig-like domain-containing protein n=1 Tax=Eiseniibacteriota bacterium TaxID=2212470 RepID=A0A938BR70_UNCEI|nr:hypothetical protein [Candidatus Eisenbacteria bacterium]
MSPLAPAPLAPLLLGIALLGTVLFGIAAGAAPAGAAPVLHFQPDTLFVAPGATEFEWAIWIDGSGDSIACFAVTLEVDTSRVALVAAFEGELYANSGQPTFFVCDSLSPAASRFIDCVLGHRTFLLGPGEIVRLRMESRTSDPAMSEALLAGAIVTDIDRQEIPGVQVESGWLRMNAPSGAPDPRDGPGARGAGGALRARPNPASGPVSIEWLAPHAASPGGVARVFEPGGRLVGSVVLGTGPGIAGTWTGRDARGRRVPPGLYLIALDRPGPNEPARVLLLGEGREAAR